MGVWVKKVKGLRTTQWLPVSHGHGKYGLGSRGIDIVITVRGPGGFWIQWGGGDPLVKRVIV